MPHNTTTKKFTNTNWIKFPWGSDASIEEHVERRVAEAVSQSNYTREDIYYIKHVDLSAVNGTLEISSLELEKLRVMCRTWDISLRPTSISSHRRIIGPIIVAFKKILFPLIQIFLKDLIQQQRNFNAATLAYIAQMSARNSKPSN